MTLRDIIKLLTELDHINESNPELWNKEIESITVVDFDIKELAIKWRVIEPINISLGEEITFKEKLG